MESTRIINSIVCINLVLRIFNCLPKLGQNKPEQSEGVTKKRVKKILNRKVVKILNQVSNIVIVDKEEIVV